MGFEVNRFKNSSLVEAIPRILCLFCRKVLKEPMTVASCSHVFCKECIRGSTLTQRVCPEDGQPFTLEDVQEGDQFLSLMLGDLEISCDFASMGCKRYVKTTLLSSHCRECPFNPETRVECRHKCGATFKRKFEGSHSCASTLLGLIVENKRLVESIIDQTVARGLPALAQIPEIVAFEKRVNEKLRLIVDQLAADVDGESVGSHDGGQGTRVTRLSDQSPNKAIVAQLNGKSSGPIIPFKIIKREPGVEKQGKNTSREVIVADDEEEVPGITIRFTDAHGLQKEYDDVEEGEEGEEEGEEEENGKPHVNGRDFGELRVEDMLENESSCYSIEFNAESREILGEKGKGRRGRRGGQLTSTPVAGPSTTFIPSSGPKTLPSIIECKGCRAKFSCYYNKNHVKASPEYYTHCVEECEKYKKLGLIRHCSECNVKFINHLSLGRHYSRFHPNRKNDLMNNRPKWMAKEVMREISQRCFPDKVNCKGCQKEFPAYNRRGKNGYHYSLEYYVHCVEQCPQYRKSGALRECPKCKCMFLNSKSFGHHFKRTCSKQPLNINEATVSESIIEGLDFTAIQAMEVGVDEYHPSNRFEQIKGMLGSEDEGDVERLSEAGAEYRYSSYGFGRSGEQSGSEVTFEDASDAPVNCEDSDASSCFSIEFKQEEGDEDLDDKAAAEAATGGTLKTKRTSLNSSQVANGSIGSMVGTDETVNSSSDVSWTTYVPKFGTLKTFPSTTNCLGCNQPFPCYNYRDGNDKEQTKPSAEYYHHCVQDCEAYKQLGFIRECFDCRLRFINLKALAKHRRDVHPNRRSDLIANRPKWMPLEVMKKIADRGAPHKVPCKGCNNLFPAYKDKHGYCYSLQFYVHCIQECPQYGALGLVRECSFCGCKFLNNKAFGHHKNKCFPPLQGRF